MWRSKRQTSIWIHETRKEIHYNLVASCLPKLHSDPTFSIVLFSPLGPQTGCGAVPRTLETPRHSPPLRSRPRDALFCITSTIKCINWKLRNFLRPINASMKEATAKHKEKHKQNYICKLGVKLPISRPWRPTSNTTIIP